MRIKKGFTLAEVLIAIGIIGVLSALMGTVYSHARPDKTKVLYLKAYDSLVTSVNMMVNRSSIYGGTYEVNGVLYNVEDYPLLNFALPADSNFSNSSFSGKLKFANLLKEFLLGTLVSSDANQVIFKTKPGDILWTVAPPNEGATLLDTNPTSVKYCNKVGIKINGNDFELCVQADGTIGVLDQKGQNYIDNRKNLRSKNDAQITTISTTSCSSKQYYIIGSGSEYTVTDVNPNP